MGIEKRDGYRLWVGGPVPPGYDGITMRNLIIIRKGIRGKAFENLLAHERVHVEQFKELGSIRFAWRYLTPYLRDRLRGYGHREAYQRIPLEVDACWNARIDNCATSITRHNRVPQKLR